MSGDFPLRLNTANQIIPLGRFLSTGDGDTEMTALTINAADVLLWKRNTTSFVPKNSGGLTAMSRGFYYGTFNAADTDTYGPLLITIHVSGALEVQLWCCVHHPNYYDAEYAGTEWRQVDPMKAIWTAPSTTLTVYKPDGVTVAYTKTLAINPAGQPIVGST